MDAMKPCKQRRLAGQKVVASMASEIDKIRADRILAVAELRKRHETKPRQTVQ